MSGISPSTTLDFDAALVQWSKESKILAPPSTWLALLERLSVALGGSEPLVKRFVFIWSRLYSATLLLDHLQDQDELGSSWLAAQPVSLQYHLAFSAYASAQYELAGLANDLSPADGARLHELWSSLVLQLAIGQYRDLTLSSGSLAYDQQALDIYEELAGQKTGAAFALALGGCTIVAGGNIEQVDAIMDAGQMIGMLLQYQDDLLDRAEQNIQPGVLTLARAVARQFGSGANDLAISVLWSLLYRRYAQGVGSIIAVLPRSAQDIIGELMVTMFGSVPDLPAAAENHAVWSAERT